MQIVAGMLVIAIVVAVARTAGTSGEDGISFFVVDGDASGLTRTPLATMDQTRKQARLDFSDVPARPLGEPGAGWAALSKTLDQAAVGLSNEMVGGAQKVLEMSVEYAKVRVQFGRPIGSFQAIKHKCADMLLEVESAKSAAYYAGRAAAEDSDELPVVASPRYVSEDFARLKYRWASCSQVKPMPPWIWMFSAAAWKYASEQYALARLAATGSSSLSSAAAQAA